MNDCIFCKIIKGDIPSTKIYEDDNFIAIQELMPVSSGHTLFIPKQHYETVYDMPNELSCKVFPILTKIQEAMKKGLECEKVRLVVWGEDVAHAHIHMIPKYKNDEVKFFKQKEASEEDRLLAAEKIIKEM